MNKRLQVMFELQHVREESCDAFECCGAVSNCMHEFVCWSERGLVIDLC